MVKQHRMPDKKHTYLVPAVGCFSYLGGGTFYTDFSTTAPELLNFLKISTWLFYYCIFNITGTKVSCSPVVLPYNVRHENPDLRQ